MTEIALKGYSLVRSGFIVAFASWILGHINAVGRAIQVSRQIEVNQRLAHQLRHEYPHEDYAGILAILNDKTLKEYYR